MWVGGGRAYERAGERMSGRAGAWEHSQVVRGNAGRRAGHGSAARRAHGGAARRAHGSAARRAHGSTVRRALRSADRRSHGALKAGAGERSQAGAQGRS